MCGLANIHFVEILRIQRLMAYLAYKAMYNPDVSVSCVEFQNGKLVCTAQFINGIKVDA